jgi:hypothetical protein
MSGSLGVAVLSETVDAVVADSEACDSRPSLEAAAVSSGEVGPAMLVKSK